MATIKFTHALKRFFPNLEELEIQGTNLNEILSKIDVKHPRFSSYIVDEQGVLRKHVNVFIDGSLIKDRIKLSDPVPEQSEIYIIQALSGG